MALALGLRTAIYHVPDLPRAKAWYTEAFGVAPYFDEPFYVGFKISGYELGLDPDTSTIGPGARGVVAYWGVADVRSAVDHFTRLGASVVEPVRDVGGGIRVATVADPFGNPIGLIENPHRPLHNEFSMRAVILIASLLACESGFIQAQTTRRPNARHGFWAGAGLGGGSAQKDCSSCSNFRLTGPSGYVRFGLTVSRRVLLGVESDGWQHSSDGFSERIVSGSVVALWYPVPAGALYVKVGLGGMKYHADDGGTVLTASARTPSIGLGYEVRVRRNVSLVPFVTGLISWEVQLYRDGVAVDGSNDFSINVVQFGLGVTWH